MMVAPSDSSFASGGTSPEVPAQRSLKSEDLLQGQREVRIVHGDETYRLLLTRNGKLILQK